MPGPEPGFFMPVIPGKREGQFPEWTYKDPSRLPRISEKCISLGREAALAGKTVPSWKDWRDVYALRGYLLARGVNLDEAPAGVKRPKSKGASCGSQSPSTPAKRRKSRTKKSGTGSTRSEDSISLFAEGADSSLLQTP